MFMIRAGEFVMTTGTPVQKGISIRNRIGDNGILLLLALGGTLLHTLLNGQYGFHRDELDILMNAHWLAWGYVAYPPLTPFIARLGLELFGPSLQGMRLLSAIGQGMVMPLAGWMARDFGGKRPAQVMAALAAYIGPAALMSGTLVTYLAFDFLWWVLLAFFTVRLLATGDQHYWLGIGAAIGLGMLTKYTIAFFVAGLVVAILSTQTRRNLLSRWLWVGAGLASLIFLPNLVWQVQHHFISLDFLTAIHARDISWGRTDGFLIDQLYVTTNPFMLPLWVAGLCFCLLLPNGRRFRAVGLMFLVTFALLLVSRGRGYYLAPAYVMLLAAGATWWENWLSERSLKTRMAAQSISWSLLAVAAIVGIVLMKPIVPINSRLWKITSDINGEVVEMVGWHDLTTQVTGIYANIPADEKPRTAILAGNYGEAGALELYGGTYGLPPVISGSNSMWARGYGDPPPETVILVGFDSRYSSQFFKECKPVGRVTNRYGVINEESSNHTILYVCRQPRNPWPEMWKMMQWFQ
jgi:hypothetical protein